MNVKHCGGKTLKPASVQIVDSACGERQLTFFQHRPGNKMKKQHGWYSAMWRVYIHTIYGELLRNSRRTKNYCAMRHNTIYGKPLQKYDVPKLLVSHHSEERDFASLAPIMQSYLLYMSHVVCDQSYLLYMSHVVCDQSVN